MLEVKFTPQGKKDLEKLSKDLQRRVVKKLSYFAQQENPLYFAKPLVDLPPVTHRFRVGDYRIAFYILKGTIYIDRIKHRREIYS